MSLRCCADAGAKLADNATCGARCGDFPGCLPAVPAELVHQVALTLHSPAEEHQAAVAVGDLLDERHTAISEGLDQKVVPEQSNLR